MVELTRLNGQSMVLNGDLIELIEARPDTIISLTTGRKIIVRESVGELVKKLFEYRKALVQEVSDDFLNERPFVLNQAM